MYGKYEVKTFLDQKKIEYIWKEHEPVYTIDEMLALGLEEENQVAKNLFLRDAKGKRHFLVVIKTEKTLTLKELGERLEIGKLAFASEERLQKYLGVEKGSVTPFGILNDESKSVEVIFDKDFDKNDSIGVHPNSNTASVFLKIEDLQNIVEEHGNRLIYFAL